MSVIERAEQRLNDEIRQHELGLDNVDDIQYWAAYLDGARAQKKDAADAIEALQAQLPKQGEIVRCRECRYRITAHGISDGWVFCSKPYTEKGNAMHRADWFCADGKREAQE